MTLSIYIFYVQLSDATLSLFIEQILLCSLLIYLVLLVCFKASIDIARILNASYISPSSHFFLGLNLEFSKVLLFFITKPNTSDNQTVKHHLCSTIITIGSSIAYSTSAPKNVCLYVLRPIRYHYQTYQRGCFHLY